MAKIIEVEDGFEVWVDGEYHDFFDSMDEAMDYADRWN